jgi:hypothetical protein
MDVKNMPLVVSSQREMQAVSAMRKILGTGETIKVCIGSLCKNASKADPKGKYLQTDKEE